MLLSLGVILPAVLNSILGGPVRGPGIFLLGVALIALLNLRRLR